MLGGAKTPNVVSCKANGPGNRLMAEELGKVAAMGEEAVASSSENGPSDFELRFVSKYRR